MILRRHLLALPGAFLSAVASGAPAEPAAVTTEWLAQHLHDPDVVVVDMTSDDLQYQRFHLPGAVRLPYGALVQRRRDGVVRGKSP